MIRRLFVGLFALLLAGWALPSALRPAAPVTAQDPPQTTAIQAVINSWTAQERVGQLLIVTFEGSSLLPETSIAQLISQYNLGGVVLLAANDNINGQVNTPRLVQALTTDLQQLAYDSATATTDRETPRAFVPLFIATYHPGNGQPATQIAKDTTPLPSLLALGATWDAGNARQVGQVAGIELSAMGINMLLGPALSLAQPPTSEFAHDLGVNSFGGEPNWVGQMAQAYVTGVHEGSQGRVAVIAQDFPGLGFADTDPAQEVPAVPRSLQQLRDFDLLPYFAVTGAAGDSLARVDGLQCANLRFQGATLRSTTGPVCVDEAAMSQLLGLGALREWRDTGLLISGPLGTRAIRRYYNATPFPHRQVAREAFLAGNDMLFLSTFGPDMSQDQFQNVADVVRFFAERYESDPVFRAAVDQALTRILSLKLALYDGDLSLQNVLLAVSDINSVGGYTPELYTIAEQGITLLAPRRESLPPRPKRNESIVIFTDVRLVQQCSYCPTYPLVAVNALETAIERRYGPYADAQIRPDQVVSFSFNQLYTYLNADDSSLSAETSQFKTNQRIGEALRDVDWIVFVVLDVRPQAVEGLTLRSLLNQDSAMMARAKTVVIALGTPTYLSSTEVSKLAAYFALYSHTQPYIDAAARALFQDSSYDGALPLSVPAIGYDVLAQTAPNPDQTLGIEVVRLNDLPLEPGVSDGEALIVRPGDRVTVQTSPILDRNGHAVHDGIPVEFSITWITENMQTRQSALTQQGVAQTTFTASRPGRIQVMASAQGTTRSSALLLTVGEGTSVSAAEVPLGGVGGVAVGSAAQSTEGAAASSGVIDAAGSAASASARDPNSPGDGAVAATAAAPRLNLDRLFLSLFALAWLGSAGYAVGRAVGEGHQAGMRVLLSSVVGGLAAYVYYGVSGPGLPAGDESRLAPLLLTVGFALIALLISAAHLRLARRR